MKKLIIYLFAIFAIAACTEGNPEDGPNNNKPSPQPQPEKSEISLDATSANFTAEGGEKKILFSTNEAWTAEIVNDRADGWLSVTPTSGSAGNATLTITAEPNDTPDERTASVRIKAGTASKTISVSQKQKDALTVTSSKFEVGAEGGEVMIEVKANIDFEYAIEDSAQDWVKYKCTRAMKTSTLTFSVAENYDTEKRVAKIYITSGEFNEEIIIYQEGTEPSIIISQNEYVVSANGETIAIEVKSNVDVTVELPTDVDWISENTTRAVSTNTYYYDILPNDNYDQRSAEIKFTNKENGLSEVVAIKQMQKDAIVLAKSEYEIGVDGSNLYFEIQTNVDVTVTISKDAVDWIQQVETRGLETKALYFKVAACSEDDDREGTITISGGNATQTIIVKQNGLKEILKKEREALIAFYKATGGDNWINNENWCSDKPVSEWYGVASTRVDNRVTWIYLPDNNLSGKINNELNALSKLEELSIFGNKITSIELEQNENLKYLYCYDNKLSELKISNNKHLIHLGCGNNALETLNVLENTELTEIACYNNNIQSLDLSQNIMLSNLICDNNKLSTLNLSNNIKLKSVSCGYNPISTIDISKNKKLEEFGCSNSQIKSLDFSNNPKLRILQCGSNDNLTSIEISKCIDLEVLMCNYCANLTTLDVSNNTKLKHLKCEFCNLTTLNVNNNRGLEFLHCYNNKLTELNVSNNPMLWELFCGNREYTTGNNLTSLDIRNNTDLQRFSCYGMSISSLDISKNTKLTSLEFSYNPIESINYVNNTALTEIFAHNTNIKSFDVSNNINLTVLVCDYNDITQIDVSNNSKLEQLSCVATLIKTLDVSYNPYLWGLNAKRNPNLETIYITDYQRTTQYYKDTFATFVYKTGAENPHDFSLYESTNYSKDGEVECLQSATKGNGIDIVLMGDGYSDRLIEEGTYDNVMNTAMEKFFEIEPYNFFRDHFNVYSVKAVSKNEGFETGYEDTCFSGYFAGDTYVGGNDQRVFSYAQNAIGDDRVDRAIIIVMMNSTAYAGTCYMYCPSYGDWGDGASISYFPVGEDQNALAQVLHHEAGGHGFSKLADEYAYESMGVIPNEEINMIKLREKDGWWKNVDYTNNPTLVKWNRFLSDSRYSNDGLGVFEGGWTYWKGVWRPTENSIMRYNTGGFNAPSREAIYYRIHKLAYGEDWEYDYEKFVEYDAINRKTAATTRGVPYRLDIPEDFKPLHPPITVKSSWREAKNSAPAKKTITRSSGNVDVNLQKVSKQSSCTAKAMSITSSVTINLPDGTKRTISTTSSGAKSEIVTNK